MAEEQKKDAAAPASDAKPAEGAEGAPAEGAGGKKKLFLIIGLVAGLLLVVGGIGAYFLLGSKHAEEPAPATLDPNASIVVYDVPPFTVNLLPDGGGEHFLKAKVALELAGEKDKAEVEKLGARLQDDWQNFLRQLRPEDTQGSAAMQRLKEALLLRANQVLSPVVVHNVLFRELLIQ